MPARKLPQTWMIFLTIPRKVAQVWTEAREMQAEAIRRYPHLNH